MKIALGALLNTTIIALAYMGITMKIQGAYHLFVFWFFVLNTLGCIGCAVSKKRTSTPLWLYWLYDVILINYLVFNGYFGFSLCALVFACIQNPEEKIKEEELTDNE